MNPTLTSPAKRKKAEALYQEALEAHLRWDMDQAVKNLEAALELTPDNASYHMTLAQILSRAEDFDRALRALANYLRLAPDSKVADRIEQLFASGLDPVEEVLTNKMKSARQPLDIIGAAIQMWMEFIIAMGEDPLPIPKPETWAAALDYTVRKLNLRDASLDDLAALYAVNGETIRKHHKEIVKSLDIMPCDYRYFTGSQNPLDKLVEAAELLEELETRFAQEA
ncbi:MAG TPA: tetratricopeptide repeat protein [Anaerolineae bacterium]|nr:tetratricopeptide repeat protein [Anaerolineae bacterium]